MVNKKYAIIYLLIALIPLIYTAMVYGSAPDTIPTHYNAQGIADAYGSKSQLWLMPGITFVIAISGLFMPFLTKFSKQTDARSLDFAIKFTAFTLAFVAVISIIIVYVSTHYTDETGSAIGTLSLYALFIFFIITGLFLPKISRNAVVGIRLPFTLMDDNNWNKTHKFAGKVWIVGGIVGIVLTFVTGGSFWVGMGVILATTLITFLYSIILYYKK